MVLQKNVKNENRIKNDEVLQKVKERMITFKNFKK